MVRMPSFIFIHHRSLSRKHMSNAMPLQCHCSHNFWERAKIMTGSSVMVLPISATENGEVARGRTHETIANLSYLPHSSTGAQEVT